MVCFEQQFESDSPPKKRVKKGKAVKGEDKEEKPAKRPSTGRGSSKRGRSSHRAGEADYESDPKLEPAPHSRSKGSKLSPNGNGNGHFDTTRSGRLEKREQAQQ